MTAALDVPGRAPAPSLLRPRILLPLLLISLIWGSTWIVIRDQISTIAPAWSVTWRFTLAGVAMLILGWFRGENMAVPRAVWPVLALMGVLQFSLNFNLVYASEAYITSGIVAVIFAALIIPNSLLSRWFLGTRFDRRFVAGAAIALIGIGLMLLHEARAIGADPSRAWTGVALAATAVMCASVSNVLQAGSALRTLPPFTPLGWAMVAGSIANGIWAWASVGPPVLPTAPGYLAGLFYLAIIGSVVTFPLYFALIRDIGAGPAAWSSVLVPIIAMAISTVAEGYVWSPLSLAGALLALIGLVTAIATPRR